MTLASGVAGASLQKPIGEALKKQELKRTLFASYNGSRSDGLRISYELAANRCHITSSELLRLAGPPDFTSDHSIMFLAGCEQNAKTCCWYFLGKRKIAGYDDGDLTRDHYCGMAFFIDEKKNVVYGQKDQALASQFKSVEEYLQWAKK